MVKINIQIVDYIILSQLVLSLLFFIFSHNKYEAIVVYFSFIVFFSYWLIRIIFNPKYSKLISN